MATRSPMAARHLHGSDPRRGQGREPRVSGTIRVPDHHLSGPAPAGRTSGRGGPGLTVMSRRRPRASGPKPRWASPGHRP